MKLKINHSKMTLRGQHNATTEYYIAEAGRIAVIEVFGQEDRWSFLLHTARYQHPDGPYKTKEAAYQAAIDKSIGWIGEASYELLEETRIDK